MEGRLAGLKEDVSITQIHWVHPYVHSVLLGLCYSKTAHFSQA